MNIAAVDLGSNTFRLVIADPAGEGLAQKRVWQLIPRLSQGLAPGGPFHPEALTRAREAAREFAGIIAGAGVTRVRAGATMAARLSAEGPAFIAELSRLYGWETRILTGEQEARLTAAGVLSGLASDRAGVGEALIFDIGGRSTEFVLVKRGRVERTISLDMGSVGLTESHLPSDPPSAPELAALEAAVDRHLADRLSGWLLTPGRPLIGTAGTVTTIAAMLLQLTAYDPDRVNGFGILAEPLGDLYKILAGETVAERSARPGLPPRRADVIVAGMALTQAIGRYFQTPEIRVSDNGLLEGLWLLAAGRYDLDRP